jgi:hypothetical protein
MTNNLLNRYREKYIVVNYKDDRELKDYNDYTNPKLYLTSNYPTD